MKKIILSFVLLITFPAFPQKFNTEKLDSLFTLLSQKNQAMGNVAIYQNGSKAYARSFGYRNIELRDQGNTKTLYRIGSVSKTYTATIILQLIKEGKINLDSHLDEFFPELPNASKISIEHLLNHQSGLVNFTDDSEYTSWMEEGKSHEELLELFKKNGSHFEPGKKMEYSNTNYVLLSFIAEQIEDKKFKKIVEQRLITPLNLKRTRFGGTIRSKNNEAYSYFFKDKKWALAPQTDMSVSMGAGGIVSTARETAKFYSGLFTKDLIDKESIKKMMEMQQGYGYGIIKTPYRDKEAYGHNGTIDGFNTTALYFPEEQTSVVITLNANQFSINDILIGTLDIYFGYDYVLPKF